MYSRTSHRRRRSRRAGYRQALDDAVLNVRTAGWLVARLWRPAFADAIRHGRRRNRHRS
jgi:hypothetical protein